MFMVKFTLILKHKLSSVAGYIIYEKIWFWHALALPNLRKKTCSQEIPKNLIGLEKTKFNENEKRCKK